MPPTPRSRSAFRPALDASADPSGSTGDRVAVRARAALLMLIALYGGARVRSADHWDILDDVNLAVHETGHLIFSPLGETLTVLGGSLFQVLVPAAFVAYFVRTHQRYAAWVTLAWVGTSLFNVARYIGDARAQELPLLGGENTIHDWWYLLIERDLLAYDTVIARWVHFAGTIAFVAAVLGGWMSLRARRTGPAFRPDGSHARGE